MQIFLGLFILIAVVSSISLISFVNPTPSGDNVYTRNTSIEINISVEENDLSNLVYNWNGTNYTIYNDSLVLMMNLNNLTSLGENFTYAVDLSRYSNNATLYSASWNSSGKYGSALNFDGTNSYAQIPDSPSLNITGNLTLSAWIKANSWKTNRWEGTIIGKDEWSGGGSLSKGYVLRTGASGVLSFTISTAGSVNWREAFTSALMSTNTWYHVAGTFNGTDLIVYINGVRQGSTSGAYSLMGVSSYPLDIGMSPFDTTRKFNGLIDEARVWNRTLSANEIYQQYVSNLNKFNSTQWYLYVNQSQNATLGLPDGAYAYQTFATNSSGSMNSTGLRTFTVDTLNPRINFTNPTPANATTMSNTSFIVNVSIAEQNLNSLTYNWNNTNYTIYNNSLLVMMNFENLTSLGENATSVADLSLYSNNATVIGGNLWNSSGKYGGAYQYSGTAQYISIPDSNNLDGSIFTASAWVYYQGESVAWNRIFSKKNANTDSNGWEVTLWSGTSGDLYLAGSGGTPNVQLNCVSNWVGTGWHHVVAIYNNTNVSLYCDGRYKGSGAITAAGANTQNLVLGKVMSETGNLWNGLIDEVKIWNRTISSTEAYQEYVSNLNKFNSTQWYLYVNQSQNATLGLPDGAYTYRAFTTDLAGNANQTEQRIINIQSLDTLAPQIDFISPTPANWFNTTNASLEINVSIIEQNLNSLVYSWNYTNYTLYNTSLILMYNFDNRSSLGENATYVVDVSRYSNNATLINGSTWNSSGKYNGAYQFDGVNDYIRAPLVTNKIANVTISAWFKTNKYNQAGQMILYVGSDAASNGYGFAVNKEGITDGTFYVLYGAVAWYDSGSDITDSNWHHGVLVINSTGKPNLYLDGAFIYGSATGAINTPTLYTEIGRNDFPAARYFNGSIDEVRIWNRSLSANEVYQQYVSNLNKFNSTQWYLYVNQSKNATLGLDIANYTYQIFANDVSNNSNYSELRTISIIPTVWPQINLDWIYPTSDINVTQLEWFNISVNVSCSVNNCTNFNVTLDPEPNTLYNFTTCGASGRTGPNQTQCNSNYTGTTLSGSVNVTNGIQYWTVPVTGNYFIEAVGAAGGNGSTNTYRGGYGARMNGTFSLIEGQVLKILVGQRGTTDTTYSGGGGGGGTFVATSDNSPLIVAGGGGGGGGNSNAANGQNASLTPSGKNGSQGVYTGGINGLGGGAGSGSSGGGGFYGNGTVSSYSGAGIAFISNGSGGSGGSCSSGMAGGFGGGSGGEWCNMGATGAGGGYSGGAGTSSSGVAGGGGSYNNGTNQANSTSTILGNGYVLITYVSSVTKSGVVSMNSSVNTFWTNVTNPYNLSLNVGESQVITWTVNATGAPNLANRFFVYANLTSNFSIGNQTSKLNITIREYIPPTLNITYPLNTTYASVINHLNYTYYDYNGAGSCWFSNSSGILNSSIVVSGTNFTNLSSIDGNNEWRVYCNDSSNNINYSSIIFQQRIPRIALDWIYPTDNINVTQLEWFNVSVNVSCQNGNCGEINVTLDPEVNTIYNFTTCSASGQYGPTQANCTTNYTGTTLSGSVNVTNGIQNWTVPATGTYTIKAAGAVGGYATSYASNPGRGAIISGRFVLSAGQVIKIVVGQKGVDGTTYGGGGGGTFVINSNNDPLIIAGGGGGSYTNEDYRVANSDANTSSNGRAGRGTSTGGNASLGGSAGNNGNGAAGGGGFIGNGTNGYSVSAGGRSFISNSTGGAAYNSPTAGAGGFGGGAGASGTTYFGGGGGGGYSGGGGGNSGAGGGGGSLNNGTNQNNTLGLYSGNGFVEIQFIGAMKSGVISMNSSTIGFYTNVTNPYNLSLNVGESQVITWTVNATGTANIINQFFAYANLSSNFSVGNQTSKLNITIKDITAPTINITYPLNTTYNYVINSLNYTYTDYSGSGSCWYSNSSGIWNSSAVTAGTNFTNVDSSSGSNTWRVYCNDSSGNLNYSTIVFNKRIPSILIDWIYPTTNISVNQLEFFNVSVNVSCISGNCGEVNVSLDPTSTVYNFTTCGVSSSRTGPNQTQCNSAYSGTSLAGLVTVGNGTQNWTVPTTGTYAITAVGASGKKNNLYLGGYGAKIYGEFSLNAGDVIMIVVGQNGTGVDSGSNSGGGGSFVVKAGTTLIPLVVAGGGGGIRLDSLRVGCNASIYQNATAGSGSSSTSTCAYKTTGIGQGGTVTSSSYGSAGAGFYANGASDAYGGSGGYSFGNGSYGGTGSIVGGFGGGGSGLGSSGGGGGGGYSGGDGGFVAGGGGSFNNGTNQNNTVYTSQGNGFVTIEALNSKGGLVSTNSNSTPFYTNVTNPYNLTLNEGESQIITWTVNATSTYPNTPYPFFVYANATFNLSISNQTGFWNISVIDLYYPIINITYPQNTTYRVNLSTLTYTYSDYSSGGLCWYSNSTNANSSIVSVGSFTNLITSDGSNTFTVWCNDSSGNLNYSTVTFFRDTIYPVFFNYADNNGTMNGTGIARFNVTINNTNGTVLFEISGANYTANNISANIWNYSLELTNGTYSYRWHAFGNGTLNNLNTSNQRNYTLLGTLNVTNITTFNSTGTVSGIVPQGTNLTINVTVNNAANILIKIWRTFIGGQLLWQGFMTNIVGNLWGATISTNSTWPLGQINFTIFVNDSLRNQQNYSGTFNVSDTTPPVIYLKLPLNGSFTNNATQYFSSNFSENDVLVNATLYIWNSSSYLINSTSAIITGSANTTNISVTLPLDGIYRWNYYSCDNSSNCAFNSTNFTITYDSTPPLINITYPQNITYNINMRWLNYTYTDTNGNASCWYSNSSGYNFSIVSSGVNFTNVNSSEGSNTWRVYCNDSANNINFSSVTFEKDTPSLIVQLLYPLNNTNVSWNDWFYVSANITCLNANCNGLNVTLDPASTTYNFTTCSASGLSGPSQANCNANYTGTTLSGLVGVTNGIQNWTVPSTGTYTIEVAGAKGGGTLGGNGSKMIGTFSLTQGTVLFILVGQLGGIGSNNNGGGGGGGSFVANGSSFTSSSPLIVAGGGGGTAENGIIGLAAVTTINGTDGSGSTNNKGINGNGGGAGTSTYRGSGGGGFYGNGTTGYYSNGGGRAFLSGGNGGTQGTNGGPGGFGGGGANGWWGGGAGGGYSGGGGGATDSYGGGGGGSYNIGTSQNNTNGTNSGNGYVTITYSGGKGGTVSMNSTATPFWTNVTNPYNLTLNEGESQTLTWWVNSTGSFGNTYEFFVYANITDDLTLGNQSAKINITISNITIDLTAPTVNLIYPLNGTGSGISSVNLYANFSDVGGLSNSTLYVWNSSSYLINTTFNEISGYNNDTNITINLGYENAYRWNYRSCDNSSNCRFNSQNNTFYYDTTPPYFINIQNITGYSNESLSSTINASDNLKLDSFVINWTINFTINKTTGLLRNSSILGIAEYYINITINDTANNINSTIIKVTILNATDSTYPLFTNHTASPSNNTEYSPGRLYQFNITISNTNGTSGIQFNGTNYSMSNLSSVFNRTLSNLAAGNYSYYFWAFGNGTRNLYNKTSWINYTLTKNTSAAVYTYINHSRENFTIESNNYVWLNSTLFNVSGNIKLYKNGTLINSGNDAISNNTWFNVSGIYNITSIFSGNANYTSSSETFYLNVTPAPLGAQLTLAWIYPNEPINVSQDNMFNISANVTCLGANCQALNTTLYYDTGCSGTAVYSTPSGTENCSSIKSSTFSCSKSHDGSTSTGWFSLTQSTPEFIYWDFGSTKCISGLKVYPWATYDNQIANVDVSEDGIAWTTILSSWRINNGSSWNENLSFNEVSTRYLRLNFTSTPSYASVAEIQIKSRSQTRGIVTFNSSASPFYTNITNPYNLTLNVNQSQVITWWVNSTGSLNTTYQFSVFANQTSNRSVGAETSRVNITLLDTTPPRINITYPLNTSYSSDVNTINYYYYDRNANGSCWYSNSSGIWNSSSVSSGINFTNVNSTLGSNTWTVYCNDSFGNINSSSVIFSKSIPSINLNVLYPTSNINVNYSEIFNVTVNVSCLNGNCEEVNVSLDPETGCSGTAVYSTPDGTESCSSTYSGYSCRYTHDGNLGTRWYSSTSNNNEYVYWDLNSTKCISGIKLYPTSGYSNQIVKVEVSNNLISWTTVLSSWNTGTGGSWNENASFDEVSGRYLRINFTSKPSYASITDVQIKTRNQSKGLISTDSTATPFWTNITNPYNLTLNVNQSQVITWWVNATGSLNTTYVFYAYATKNSNTNITNITSTWRVTIANGTTPLTDNNYPIFSNYQDNNGGQTGIGLGRFNVTLNNTNGTVWLEINNTNVSATNITSNIYTSSYTFTLNKTYSYRWFAYGNGTSRNLNNSGLRNYSVIATDTTPPRITLTSPLNTSYRTNTINVSLSLNEASSWCGYSLNGNSNVSLVSVNSTFFNYTTSISDGNHIIIVSCNDTSNNFNSTSRRFMTDFYAPYVSISSPSNTTYNTRSILLSIATNADAVNTWFNRGLGNETYSSSSLKTFNEGSNTLYAYANDSLGNLNSTSTVFFIDSLPPSITVNSPQGITYTSSIISFNITTNENSYCWLELNSSNNYTLQNNGNRDFNRTVIVVDGTYPINYYCNDSLNNLAVSSLTFAVDTVPPQISLNSPVSLYRTNSTIQFNYTPMASDGLDTCELWGNWTGVWHKNDSTNSLNNYSENFFTKTLGEGSYIWNIWCNNTISQNDWSTQGNVTFTVDTTPPFVSFISPTSRSYNTSIIGVDITNDSQALSLWWSNGSLNQSYTLSSDISLPDGNYTFIAYANDSAGNLNQSIINFNVDTTLPIFFNFLDNNATFVGNGTGMFNVSINNTNSSVSLSINNTIINVTLSNNIYTANYTFSSQGVYSYYWSAYSNGTSHLLGTSETRYFTVNNTDIEPPSAELITPENNTYANITEINFTVSINDTTPEIDTESGIKNATLKVYNETSLVNQTTFTAINNPLTSTVGIVVTLVDGIYNWFYSIFDFAGNLFTTGNNTLIVHTEYPVVRISYPENNSYTKNDQIGINYTISESYLSSCWYDDEGYSSGNIISGCRNISSIWEAGQHNITLYVNDSAGNTNSTRVRFIVDNIFPQITLNSPENAYTNGTSYFTSIQFNCSTTDNYALGNLSLYLTDSANQTLALNQTTSLSGTSNGSSWSLSLPKGNYTWNCYSSDLIGNSLFSENQRTLILNFADSDNDRISNNEDNLKGNESDVETSGIINLNISVGGNTTYGSYDDTREIAFLDPSDKIVNFTHNFSLSDLDLSLISIIKETNAIIINLSGQLQSGRTKSVYIDDNNFVELCVKDSEVSSSSEITSSCTEVDETNFTDCVGNSVGVSRNSLFCIDEGSTIRVDNLLFSAIRGTPRVTPPSSPVTDTGSSGGGGGAAIIKNKTKIDCTTSKDCSVNNYCFENICHPAECKTNSDCSDGKFCFDLRCVKLFDVKILEVSSQIDAGNFIHFKYFLKAMANINNDVIVNFWLEKDGKTISSGKDTIFIGNMEEKTEETKIFIPTNTPPGLYNFYVSVTYDKYSAESYRQIQIDERGNILLSKNNAILYLVPLLVLIIILLSLIVIKLYRKKIKDLYRYEQEYALTHKLLISLICISIIGLIIISILNILDIISLPSLNDYSSYLSEFVTNKIIPNILAILISAAIVAIIYFIARHKRKINRAIYGGEALVIDKKNYIEHGLKKIHNNFNRWKIQRSLRSRVNVLEKKGYDVELVKKESMKDKINDWKSKGYDTEVLRKNEGSQRKQLDEWRRKGYDVDALKR